MATSGGRSRAVLLRSQVPQATLRAPAPIPRVCLARLLCSRVGGHRECAQQTLGLLQAVRLCRAGVGPSGVLRGVAEPRRTEGEQSPPAAEPPLLAPQVLTPRVSRHGLPPGPLGRPLGGSHWPSRLPSQPDHGHLRTLEGLPAVRADPSSLTRTLAHPHTRTPTHSHTAVRANRAEGRVLSPGPGPSGPCCTAPGLQGGVQERPLPAGLSWGPAGGQLGSRQVNGQTTAGAARAPEVLRPRERVRRALCHTPLLGRRALPPPRVDGRV